MIKSFKDFVPRIHEEVFIAETSMILGRVNIGLGSSVWYNAVLRGDINYITIGEHTNIQDNAVLHVGLKYPVEVGDYTSIGHGAVVHGCKIGSHCLIGMNATVLNGAVVGDRCIVGAGSVVTQNTRIPPNSLAVGTPAKVIKQITAEELKEISIYARRYEYLWRKYYT
ncbi:MAG: gamma carbonic anhydrase family protein [Bacillota bacterium]